MSSPLPWQTIAQKAQQHRDTTLSLIDPPIPDIHPLPLDSTTIPKTILTSEELAITESDPVDLVSKLSSGSLTSTQITKSFLRRAALAQKLSNCVTELLPVKALERAEFLDGYLKEHGKPIGPLHGLPISVKEHINIASLPCNAGFIAWHDRIPTSNAHLIDILLAAGAVLYARTTQPQTLMHLSTSSAFFPHTTNPYNRHLTAGGSSGGEGALLGLRGSCLGIGTDIGGSIRSPAANCGVYGFRPTSLRLPISGFSATMLGQEHVVPVVGPLSTSLEGVGLFMRTVLGSEPWRRDQGLVPMPWREGGGWGVKIGVLWDDGVVKPHPPILRALKEVVEKLQGVEGVEVVEWKPYRHDYAWSIIASLYFCDGGRRMNGENEWVKKLSVKEIWEWQIKRDAYKLEYAQLWGDVDGPGAAPPLDCARYWGYTSQWNLLDYPAIVFPVTKVDQTFDLAETEYVPRNEKDKYNYELYSPDTYTNAPVSLQLVGKRYEDEKVIEALEYIQEKIGLPFVDFV
ncbi:amidase signature domain-containing protein [Dendryphion nanum]|uniref:amidase n=1 Tax=Dendryphion nanum TaxID=256645 RepID=A0A9P9IPY5_9PLEO|nr:amidase signature domain-containing protein [Dendryphion nanum]